MHFFGNCLVWQGGATQFNKLKFFGSKTTVVHKLATHGFKIQIIVPDIVAVHTQYGIHEVKNGSSFFQYAIHLELNESKNG